MPIRGTPGSKERGNVVAILEVNHLNISFSTYAGLFRQRSVAVIRDLHLTAESGSLVAVVGASGSGKSLLAHAILGILPNNASVSGSIRYDGEELTPDRLQKLRGKEIAFVPQSVKFLDPLMTAGALVRSAARGGEAKEQMRRAFARYRLAPETDRLYPHQLSGGMARRVLAAAAAVAGANLIVADEPTPGLDAAAVQETMGHLRELANEGAAVLLITHDIEAALAVADRIAVFYGGTVIETALAADFAGEGQALRHPYTRALWKALPRNGFVPLPAGKTSAIAVKSGCPFAPQCPQATEACLAAMPGLRELRGGTVRCVHAE